MNHFSSCLVRIHTKTGMEMWDLAILKPSCCSWFPFLLLTLFIHVPGGLKTHIPIIFLCCFHLEKGQQFGAELLPASPVGWDGINME